MRNYTIIQLDLIEYKYDKSLTSISFAFFGCFDPERCIVLVELGWEGVVLLFSGKLWKRKNPKLMTAA